MITFLEISAAVNMQQGGWELFSPLTVYTAPLYRQGVVEQMEVLTLNPIDHKSATTTL